MFLYCSIHVFNIVLTHFLEPASNRKSSDSYNSFKKVGSFSSEDSLGGFNLSTSKDLPDDLANVDTVDLESMIQAKRDLMKQLEEKENKYLRKIKKLPQPRIVSGKTEIRVNVEVAINKKKS